MIDGMVSTLKQEQMSDDNKKEYCVAQFDGADDKKKGLERAVSDEDVAIANAKDGIATLKEEIAGLELGIKALDQSVAEATEQRKSEHEDFTELIASDTAAKELLGYAKNRLNKFYNPKLFKPPPKVELSAEDRIFVNEGGTVTTAAPGGIAGTGITALAQVSAQVHHTAAPESSGVIAMIDLLIKDLDKQMAEAETAEKDAQSDYETLMSDAGAKRTADSKA